jgi:hypothetical protein
MKKLWSYFYKRLISLVQKPQFTDKSTKQLAIEFDMSDIKTTREGEHQTNYLTRKNKFTEKEYAHAEKYATRKKGVNKDKIVPPSPPVQKEARPGDSAIWGGGMQGMNMQSILAGQFSKPVGPSLGKEVEFTDYNIQDKLVYHQVLRLLVLLLTQIT